MMFGKAFAALWGAPGAHPVFGEQSQEPPQEPSNTAAPGIVGTPTEGQTATATPGTWTGSYTSITQQWRRGSTTVGTGLTYTMTAADVGASLLYRERAVWSGGNTAWVESNAIGPVAALGALTGTLFVGSDPLMIGEQTVLRLSFAQAPSTTKNYDVVLTLDAGLSGPASPVAVSCTSNGAGVGTVDLTITATSASAAATATASYDGDSFADTVSINAWADQTDTFDGTASTQVRTRPGWARLPTGEETQTPQLVINGSGVASWASATSPGPGLIFLDAGSTSMDVEYVVAQPGTTGLMYVDFAAVDASNCLRLETNASGQTAKVYKIIAGVATQIGSSIGGFGALAGATVKIEFRSNTGGTPESLRLIVGGVEKTGAAYDWSGVTLGSKAGISSASKRGSYSSFRVTGRAPVAVLSQAVVDQVEIPDADVTAVGHSRLMRVHVTGLTPSATQDVDLEVLAGTLAGDVCAVGQAVHRSATASRHGTAWIDYTLIGAGVGEQTVAVRSRTNTITAPHNVATFTGVTASLSATTEDPLRVELSFSGLPPLVSHEIPVSIAQPAGLAEFAVQSVLVAADAAGNGVGVLGGFAGAAGTHTLAVTACGVTRNCVVTVAALSLAGAKRMDDPATFGGAIPAAGAAVTLPTGVVIWDTTAARGWASLTVPSGCKLIDDQAVDGLLLDPNWMLVEEGGMLLIGRALAKRAKLATINLKGLTSLRTPRVPLPGQTTEGFIVTDPSRTLTGQGHIIIHAEEPEVAWTPLGATSAAGSQTLTTAVPTGWPAGSEIIVTPSAFPSLGGTEVHTLTADASGTSLSIAAPLARRAWGQMIYATDAGASLTPGTFVAKRPHPRVADTVDERAMVGLLTRFVVITCPNDTSWTADGHGVTTISHNRDSAYWFTGVHIKRCGQRGVIEHYPWHAHFKTYAQVSHDFSLATGVFLGDAAHAVFRGSAVSESMHRGTTIHATTGAKVQRSVIYDTRGHTVMLEEGSEHRYWFEGNLVATIAAPASGDAILDSDRFKDAGDTGPAAFWLTTPQGICRGNVGTDGFLAFWNALSEQIAPVVGAIGGTATGAVVGKINRAAVTETWTLTATSTTQMSVSGSVSGAQAALTKGTPYNNGVLDMAAVTGTWTAGQTKTIEIVKGYAGGCVGLSSALADIPFNMPFIDWRDNAAGYNRMAGTLTGINAVNDAGNVGAGRIDPRRNGLASGLKQRARLRRMRTYGNERGGYSHQTSNPGYEGFVHSSWIRTGMFGGTAAADDGRSDFLLWVGRSPRMTPAEIALQETQAVVCIASYHDTMLTAYGTALDVPDNPVPTNGIIGQRGGLEFGGFIATRDLYTDSNPEHWFKSWFGMQFVNVPDTQLTPPAHIELDYVGNGGGQDVYHGAELPRYTLSGVLTNNCAVLASSRAETDVLNYDHAYINVGSVLRGKTKVAPAVDRFGFRVEATDTQAEPGFGNREGMFYDREDMATGGLVGTWGLKNSNEPGSSGLANFHHCVMLQGGRYRVYNGETGAVNAARFGAEIQWGNDTSRSAVIALPWSGAVPPKVHVGAVSVTTWVATTTALANGSAASYSSVADLAAVKATPRTMWHDTANNKLWIHFQGGYATTPNVPDRGDKIYIGVTPA